RAAGGSGGRDGDGAQAGTDRLPGAEARDDVRASESGGVRGPDEGKAAQGVAAEGAPVGAGGGREDAGQRANRSGSVGAGGKEGTGVSAVAGQRAEGNNGQERGRTASRTDPWLWQERVRPRESRGERSPRCAEQAGWRTVPCNRRTQRSGPLRTAPVGGYGIVCPKAGPAWK